MLSARPEERVGHLNDLVGVDPELALAMLGEDPAGRVIGLRTDFIDALSSDSIARLLASDDRGVRESTIALLGRRRRPQ